MIYLTSEKDLKIDGWQYLYFYTSWMPFHKKMTTMISKVENKYNIIFYAIDADAFNSLVIKFNITSVPVVLILKDGYEIKKINGLVLTSAFKSAFADICNT